MSDTRFAGYSPAALRFLAQLARHNDREWFAPRKAVYEAELLAPTRALLAALNARFARRRIPLYGDAQRSVFRIYRDVRFGADKRPYQTYQSVYCSRDGGRHTPGGLYVRIEPGACMMAIAFYALEPRLLAAFRAAISAEPKRFARLQAALARRGLAIAGPGERPGDALARMPRGYERFADSPCGPYLRLRSFVVRRPLPDAAVLEPGLVEAAVDFTVACKPLLLFGWTLEREVPAAPR